MRQYRNEQKITRYHSPATFKELEDLERESWEQTLEETRREVGWRTNQAD